MMSEITTELHNAAAEIATAGHAGWGNVCSDAAREIERLSALADKWNFEADELREDNKQLSAERDELRTALKNLLEDTQHAEHEDCDEGPCPVREARELLKGQP